MTLPAEPVPLGYRDRRAPVANPGRKRHGDLAFGAARKFARACPSERRTAQFLLDHRADRRAAGLGRRARDAVCRDLPETITWNRRKVISAGTSSGTFEPIMCGQDLS
jgi:hypothetical protein